MKVWIVQGEHWSVPGRPITTHRTATGAQREALSLVNLMCADLKLPPATEWSVGIQTVKKEVSRRGLEASLTDVWIIGCEVQE